MSSDEWRRRLQRRPQQNIIPSGMVLMAENESLWFFVSFVARNWLMLRIETRSQYPEIKRTDFMAKRHAMQYIYIYMMFYTVCANRTYTSVLAHNPLRFHLIILILFDSNYHRKFVECGRHMHWPIVRSYDWLDALIIYARAPPTSRLKFTFRFFFFNFFRMQFPLKSFVCYPKAHRRIYRIYFAIAPMSIQAKW